MRELLWTLPLLLFVPLAIFVGPWIAVGFLAALTTGLFVAHVVQRIRTGRWPTWGVRHW